MAVKEKRQDLCPRCYLEGGKDIPLQFSLGSTKPLECGEGHVYPDREELSILTQQASVRRRAAAPPPPPPEPNPEPPPPINEDGEVVDITAPIPVGNTKSIRINPVDIIRLTAIVGSFPDSGSLVGAVFALNQELLDTRELLTRARAVQTVGGNSLRKVGGDEIIQVIIPERHVGSIKDIAEANGMDVTRYMNAKVEEGMDAMWYY